jgi:hypothetical protein
MSRIPDEEQIVRSQYCQAARLTAHLPDNHGNAKQASQPVQKHANPNTRSQMRVFTVTFPSKSARVREMPFPKSSIGGTNCSVMSNASEYMTRRLGT